MREIKFRVWYKHTKLIKGWDYLQSLDYNWIDCYIVDSSLVLMQYTGLKDKNGKEIYEGDILHGLSECGNHWGDGIVIYDKEELKFRAKPNKPVCTGYGKDCYECYLRIENQSYVEGNIYEHPELLKLMKEEVEL